MRRTPFQLVIDLILFAVVILLMFAFLLFPAWAIGKAPVPFPKKVKPRTIPGWYKMHWYGSAYEAGFGPGGEFRCRWWPCNNDVGVNDERVWTDGNWTLDGDRLSVTEVYSTRHTYTWTVKLRPGQLVGRMSTDDDFRLEK